MKARAVIFLAISFFFAGGFAFSQKPNLAKSDLPTVSFCDLVREPAKYEGKTVRVKGIYRTSFEVSELTGPECLGPRRRAWLSIAANQCPDSKNIGGEEFYGKLADIVAIGTFHSAGGRFGHLGGYPFEFNVACVESVTVRARPAADNPER